MKRLNARQVEAFRAVMTLSSMTKAAAMLGITQPAVSRLILDFQQAVGFQLFRRQRNGAIPTDDALRLYDEVEKLFIGLDQLNARVSEIRTLQTGRLDIVAMGLYANGLLPDLIARFMKKHPGIAVSLDSQPHDKVLDWVVSRRSDIGFTTLPVHNAPLAVHRLVARQAMCVFPAGDDLEARRTVDIADLSGRSFVSFPRGTPFRYQVDSLFDRAGVAREMSIEATTHEAVCNLVAAGVGVSIVSPFSPHLRRNPRLAFRTFTPVIAIELGLLTDEKRMSTAARHFRDFAIAHLRERTRRPDGPDLSNEDPGKPPRIVAARSN